jgi:His/Glu/Gln/Arg/opine family amino acid ABC transporter permease subunit
MIQAAWDNHSILLQGLWTTLELLAASMLLSIPIAVLFGIGRLSSRRLLRGVALVYVEVFRSLPVLVLLIGIYYGLGRQISALGVNAFWVAVICLTLNESAYLADSFRAVLVALPLGQWRAAASLGMTKRQTYLKVILPQTVAAMLPQCVNASIYLLKSSALASLITVQDLMANAYTVMFTSFQPFNILLDVLIAYLVITLLINGAFRLTRRRFAR